LLWERSRLAHPSIAVIDNQKQLNIFREQKRESISSAAWMSVVLVVNRYGRIEESSYTFVHYRHWL
jgi:hypothetical protein